MNFQDVIREVYDSSQKALKTTASLSASTVYVGNPTLYAVVNTSAAGDSVANIGFATVSVSNPTLYAVVNTSATSGLATIDVRNTVTVTQSSSARTITGNVTLSDAKTYIGLVTVTQASSARSIAGNVTLSDAKTYIGLTTTTLGVGTRYIGLATIDVGTIKAWSNPNTFIGLVTASIGNNPVLGSGLNNVGFATVAVSTPTLFAVVNTGTPGTTDVTSNSGVTVYQGGTWTVTQASAARTITGNVTLSDAKTYIGLVTVTQASAARSITGNVTLSDAKTYIGLTTATIGNAMVTVTMGTKLTNTDDSVAGGRYYPALVSLASGAFTPVQTDVMGRQILGNSNGYIGLVTIGHVAEVRGDTDNGSADSSNRPVGIGGRYLSTPATYGNGNRANWWMDVNGRGQVASWNAGTTKTLIPKTFGFALTSVATVAVPTNTFKVTQFLASANATVGVSIKSGATYLVGNASIRVSVFPGGGWVESGSPDSPVYVGLAAASAIVIEKDNATAAVAGKVIYFDE